MSGPKEQRVPLIDPGQPPPPPPPDRLPDEAELDEAEEEVEPARPSSTGRHLPVDIGGGRVLDGEIIDQAATSPHAFRFSGYSLLDL